MGTSVRPGFLMFCEGDYLSSSVHTRSQQDPPHGIVLCQQQWQIGHNHYHPFRIECSCVQWQCVFTVWSRSAIVFFTDNGSDSANCHRLVSLLVDILLWTWLSSGCFPSWSTGQIHNFLDVPMDCSRMFWKPPTWGCSFFNSCCAACICLSLSHLRDTRTFLSWIVSSVLPTVVHMPVDDWAATSWYASVRSISSLGSPASHLLAHVFPGWQQYPHGYFFSLHGHFHVAQHVLHLQPSTYRVVIIIIISNYNSVCIPPWGMVTSHPTPYVHARPCLC